MSWIVYEDNYFANSKRFGGLRETEGGKVGFSGWNQRIKNTAERYGMQIIFKNCWKFQWVWERIFKKVKSGENSHTLKDLFNLLLDLFNFSNQTTLESSHKKY